MPTLEYKRLWCKKCNDWELFEEEVNHAPDNPLWNCFTSSDGIIMTCRDEWESLGCQIDMTEVSDAEMQELVNLMYYQGDDEVMIDEAENFLITKTKAKYIEDYSDEELKAYEKRKNKLYQDK
jgi:hypothetical protein